MYIFFLFIFSYIFCSYDNLIKFYETCPDKEKECNFNLTYNYPISPKIPISFLKEAIIGSYLYVYLTFQDTQTQKVFYLEAYETSMEENIIKNGDCYLINITNENLYEIRIYKELNEDSFIRFRFFGISKNFSMIVKLEFPLSLLNYAIDENLDDENSIYKSTLPLYEYYLEEKNKQKKGETYSKSSCEIIIKNIFKTNLDVDLLNESYYNSAIIPASPFLLVSLEYTVGMDLSTQNFFKPEKNILSETKVIDGKIDSHYDRFYFKNEFLNNNNNIVNKIVELYDKKVLNMVLNLTSEIKNFTLTISTNSKNNIAVLTFKVYNDDSKTYEIQIKIQFNNENMKQLTKNATVPSEYFLSKIDDQNVTKIFDKIFFALGVFETIKYINPELDTDLQSLPLIGEDINCESINLLTILQGYEQYFSSLKLNTNKLEAIFLDMKYNEESNFYYTDFECWQQKLGTNNVYDIIFDLTGRMEKNNEGIFKYNNQTYIFWAWKGDYINLGTGAELGIYYGDSTSDFSHLKVDKSLAMSMTLNLNLKNYGNIVENWNNNGEDTWWISAISSKYKKMRPQDLTANFTVKFKNNYMFNEFAKTERKGWSYDKNKMIATLIF